MPVIARVAVLPDNETCPIDDIHIKRERRDSQTLAIWRGELYVGIKLCLGEGDKALNSIDVRWAHHYF